MILYIMHAQSDNRLIFSSERRWQFPGFVKRAINKSNLTLRTSQYQEIFYPMTDYIVFVDRKSIVSNNFFLPFQSFINTSYQQHSL